MGAWIRSRVGLAIMGAIVIGGVGAIFGFGSVWRPPAPTVGGAVVQNSGSANATATTGGATTTADANATATPESTATPQATATAKPTVVPPTPTTLSVGNTLRGTVLSVGSNSFVVSRNGFHYTIQVNGATTYSGAATQLSGLHGGYRVTVTIAAVQDNTTYVASSVVSSVDN